MTEQQYRVVADRDKGDNPKSHDIENGDRYVLDGPYLSDMQILRIERPVPTEHCLSTGHHDGHEWGGHDGQTGTGYWCTGFDAADQHPSVPTREQIADAIEQDERVQTWHKIWAYVCENRPQPINDERTAEQYVLALLSQPTPTAEQVSVVRCFNEQPHEAHDWTLYYAQPPSGHRCPGVIFNATAAPHTPFCVRTSTPDNPCRCWKSGSTDEED